MRTRWRTAGLLALAVGVALLSATQLYLNWTLEGFDADFGALLGSELVEWLLWAAVAPAVLWIDRRYGFRTGRLRGAVAVHLTVAAAWFLIHNGIMVTMTYLVDAEAQGAGFGSLFLSRTVIRLPSHFVVYGFVVAAGWAGRFLMDYHSRKLQSERLSSQLARSQLANLRMQLHPHFFFNTMHTIAGMVRENRNEAAVETIAELSELLRRALETADVHEITLDEELEFLAGYVRIQERRFGDRLQVTYDIDPDVRRALVPALLLQPLVENAIRHGLELDESPGRVDISAERRDGQLHLEIADNGRGLVEPRVAEGVGLGTSRARLGELYGARQSIEISSAAGSGATVQIRIPFHTEGWTARGGGT